MTTPVTSVAEGNWLPVGTPVTGVVLLRVSWAGARSGGWGRDGLRGGARGGPRSAGPRSRGGGGWAGCRYQARPRRLARDRKSTRLNSSHVAISYAVFCLKKKKPTKPPSHFKKKKKNNK